MRQNLFNENRVEQRNIFPEKGDFMKKKIIYILTFSFLISILIPITVNADMGPKPSVRIAFKGLENEICYATLLSKTESTGPASAWDGTEENALYNKGDSYTDRFPEYDIWKAFIDYQDSDGYHFLQTAWRIDQTKELAWTYYPPSEFKILLYFPENNVYAVSGIYNRYAFDSYFTVNMEDSLKQNDDPNGNTYIKAYRAYRYTEETVSLFIRIVSTILIEIGIALIFGYRAKKQVFFITGVNTATQIFLNVLLNVINYKNGYLAFIAAYFILELIVFTFETIIYSLFLNRLSERKHKKWLAAVYALVANTASFVAGFALAVMIPGIF